MWSVRDAAGSKRRRSHRPPLISQISCLKKAISHSSISGNMSRKYSVITHTISVWYEPTEFNTRDHSILLNRFDTNVMSHLPNIVAYAPRRILITMRIIWILCTNFSNPKVHTLGEAYVSTSTTSSWLYLGPRGGCRRRCRMIAGPDFWD